VNRMEGIGLKVNDRTIANKIASGGFSAGSSSRSWRLSASTIFRLRTIDAFVGRIPANAPIWAAHYPIKGFH
jgi:hypothetical protein